MILAKQVKIFMPLCFCYDEQLLFNTFSDCILISVRSLQRSEGDVSDPIEYIPG